ncbi:transposase [Promicromonospora citrea]|uniref:transposase n=1 Tax=Promicromonospora citrea TaxID=43677 RepID=UPI0035714D00
MAWSQRWQCPGVGVGPGELTDAAWARIEPLLPSADGRRGGRWRDHRRVINGILGRLRTGAPWRAVEDAARTSAGLDEGRHLGADPGPRDCQGRLCRSRGVDVPGRLDQRPAHHDAAGARKKGQQDRVDRGPRGR